MKYLRLVSIVLIIAFISGIIDLGQFPGAVTVSSSEAPPVVWDETVPPDKVWTLTYSSPVNVLTVNSNTIKVFDSSGNELPVNIRAGVNGKEVYVEPLTPYKPGSYSLKTLGGIRSLSGADLSDNLEIDFTVDGDIQPEGVIIEPSGAEIILGGTMRFSASLSGGEASGSFTWSVSGQDALMANSGSVSTNGDYQAPMIPGTYYITARSNEYPDLAQTAAVVVRPPVQPPADFMISEDGLTNPANVTPGQSVYINIRVYNLTPSLERAGASTVRLKVGGRTIDELPFYLGENQESVLVRFHFHLPEGDYSGLLSSETEAVGFILEVDPGNKVAELNENNNTVSSQFNVRGTYKTPLSKTDYELTVDSSGLCAYSTEYYSLPNNKITAALPGEVLTLKAKIRYGGSESRQDTNIKFIVDGLVIMDENQRINRPSSGYKEVSCSYTVPFTEKGFIDFRVLLGNGSEARIKIPVIKWDVSIGAGDLYWESSTVAAPGSNISFRAVLKNNTGLTFPYENPQIAYRVLLDGVEYLEEPYVPRSNGMLYITAPLYKVPEGRTDPLVFTVIVDPYDQLEESDESNNIASITIPVINDGNPDPDFSIEPSDLSYLARPILPGARVKLSASIRNNSASRQSSNGIRVQYKINGAVIEDFRVDLRLLQYKLTTKEWVVPQDMTGNPVFEVVLDPENEFNEENTTDNTASIILEMAHPELEITENCLFSSPINPKAGERAYLSAVVRNNGIAPALNSSVKFLIDGEAAGEVVIPLIPGSSASTAVCEWQIPEPVDLAELPWAFLEGFSGKIPLPSGITRDYTFRAMADSSDIYQETDEDNNLSTEKILTVYIPYENHVVYARVIDILGSVPDAEVELSTASGDTATALTAEDGWCSFTGVESGSYTLTVRKEGYETLVSNSSPPGERLAYNHELQLQRTSEMVAFCENDSDGDLLSDELELLYGTKINDSDTDKDGVIDGKDNSPLMNPLEPSFIYLQKTGMVRLDQPICAYGLDGWVEVWDMDFHLSTMSNELVYKHTYEDHGTRSSTMTEDTYKRAVNKLYESEKFKAYYAADIMPQEIGYEDTERTHDHQREDSWTFSADAFHRTEYRFYYDYLTDYRIVSLKNSEEILYPSGDEYFSYLLMPLKLKTGCSHSFNIQFTHSGLADMIFYDSESRYNDLGFQYSFYSSNDFNDDENLPYCQGIALVDNDGSSLFSFAINLPSEHVLYASSYLKITPIWIEKNGSTHKYKPACVSAWDITGIMREVVYEQDMEGNMKTLKEHFTSISGYNTDIMDYQSALSYSSSSNAKTSDNWGGTMIYDPDAPEDERYSFADMQIKGLYYADKSLGVASKSFSIIEKIVLYKNNKVKDVSKLPESHWIRQPKYGKLLASVAVAQGIVSIYTNGLEAWKAHKEGDNITCVYYSTKTVTDAAGTAMSLAAISKNVVAWSGKTGRFAKLASKEAGVYLALVTGAVEASYNAAKWAVTDDPIKKSAYGEKVFESLLDTGMGLLTIAYAPLLAFQITWTIGVELYGLFAGSDLAYKVAKSPTGAVVFIYNYWAENVPSQIAEEAYNSIRDDLMTLLESINIYGNPFMAVFIDPQI